jgi:hypothetical protein
MQAVNCGTGFIKAGPVSASGRSVRLAIAAIGTVRDDLTVARGHLVGDIERAWDGKCRCKLGKTEARQQ